MLELDMAFLIIVVVIEDNT